MPNIHILDLNKNDIDLHCIFHIPVPLGNNAAGSPWTVVVKAWLEGQGAIVSNLPTITAVELQAVQNGEIIEIKRTIRFSDLGLTNAQRLTEIKAAYTKAELKILTSLQQKLIFYNHTITM